MVESGFKLGPALDLQRTWKKFCIVLYIHNVAVRLFDTYNTYVQYMMYVAGCMSLTAQVSVDRVTS